LVVSNPLPAVTMHTALSNGAIERSDFSNGTLRTNLGCTSVIEIRLSD